MHLVFISLISVFAGLVPLVSACEGECIVAITNAFLGNYSRPLQNVLKELGEQVSTQLLPSSRRPADPTVLMHPILATYMNTSYNLLETAIFPSYFHGKCQRFSKDGQNPPGCPNPDCPVVCGTPGSLVHFYPTLRYIAYNSTRTTLEAMSKPGNPAYDQVEALVKTLQSSDVHRRDSDAGYSNMIEGRNITSSAVSHGMHGFNKRAHARQFGSSGGKRGAAILQVRSTPTLATILAQFNPMFEKVCGGNARDANGALPKCSWEDDMKRYILSFP